MNNKYIQEAVEEAEKAYHEARGHEPSGEFPKVRTFATGATRDTNAGKPDYTGYCCPLVKKRFGEYMLNHQTQSDGQVREANNWKKGIPYEEYIRSGDRHWTDVLLHLDGFHATAREELEEALCAMFFHVQGALRALLLEREIR